jgi:hypothetical protein
MSPIVDPIFSPLQKEETMKRDSVFLKILRWVGIILMGLTSLFTLMGGIGTVCAALFPENFAANSEAMAALIGWNWLYIIFMLVTIAIGVMMVRATVLLIKGMANAYRDTLISLVAGVVVGFIHIYASRTIRGGSMPVDMVTYTAVFTLIVFLVFRISFIWQGVNFEKPTDAINDNRPASVVTLLLGGVMTFSIQYMVSSTHTWGGVNYGDAFHLSMMLIGIGLILFGLLVAVGERKHRTLAKPVAAREMNQ